MKRTTQAINFCKTWLAVFALSFGIGCQSTGSKDTENSDKYSTLRLFVGINPDSTGRHQTVPIYRADPMMLTVASTPFLDEGYVMQARVVESVGGFSIQVQYDERGTGLLENATYRYRNRHLAIHSSFSDSRWLAAPVIQTPITNGLLVFTPDATREEADRIVDGLNALSKKIRKK